MRITQRHKRSLHIVDHVIDRHALTFVEDLNAEDLGRAHRAVLVGAGERDVEGQDLVAIPGGRQFLVRSGVGDGDLIQLADGGADGGT